MGVDNEKDIPNYAKEFKAPEDKHETSPELAKDPDPELTKGIQFSQDFEDFMRREFPNAKIEDGAMGSTLYNIPEGTVTYDDIRNKVVDLVTKSGGQISRDDIITVGRLRYSLVMIDRYGSFSVSCEPIGQLPKKQ